MKILILATLFLHGLACTAQLIRSPVSETHLGMGAYSKNHVEAFSFSNNQAALANLEKTAAALYTENRFMMEELKLIAIVFALPLKKAGAGFSVNRAGFKDYHETEFGLAYGRQLSENLSLGVQIDYYLHHIAGYGNFNAIGVQAGMVYKITERLRSGIHVYNPVGGRFSGLNGEKMASVYTAGWGYEVSDRLFMSLQFSKEESMPGSIIVAIHYAFDNQFFVRCGMATGSDRSFAALGFLRDRYSIQLSASWHLRLGLTPSLLLAFPFS